MARAIVEISFVVLTTVDPDGTTHRSPEDSAPIPQWI